MIKNATRHLFLFSFLPLAICAQAQESVTTDLDEKDEVTSSDKSVERMEITGSHIKRIDLEGARPIQVLDRKYLDQAGHHAVGDIFRDLAITSFGVLRESSMSASGGVSNIGLRGLGATRTLILLNGRRLAKEGMTDAPDMNLVPMEAVKRIEILKGNASAIYGSDALAGAINIITKKDFTVSELKVRQEVSEFRGGHKTTVGGTFGAGSNRTKTITSLQYRRSYPVFARDRKWSRFSTSNHSVVPNVATGRGGFKALPHCPSIDPSDGTCIFNPHQYMTDYPDQKSFNLLTNIQHNLNSETILSLQFSGVHKKVEMETAPGIVNLRNLKSSFIDELNLPGHVPGDPISAKWRMFPLGNRISESTTNSLSVHAGVERTLGESWNVTFLLGSEENKAKRESLRGFAYQEPIHKAIEAGECNIFEEDGECRLGDHVRYSPYQKTLSRLHSIKLVSGGELIDLPTGGEMSFAIGGETNIETFSNIYDSLSLVSGVIAGGNAGSIGKGKRQSSALFAELYIPVISKIDVQVAGRYDDYSDFGNSFNPQANIMYRPFSKLLLRAAVGTGFKAPNLSDVYSPKSVFYPFFVDHVACERAMESRKEGDSKTPNVCKSKQYMVETSGAKNLKEENSTNINVGLAFEPLKGLSATLDFHDTQLKDVVGRVPYGYLTEIEQEKGDLSKYHTSIERDSSGHLVLMKTANLLNLARQRVRGLDLGIKWDTFIPRVGSLSFNNSTSYLLKHEYQAFPGSKFFSYLRYSGIPQWKNNFVVNYSPQNRFKTALSFQTVGSQRKANRLLGKLKVYTSVNAQGSYTFQKPGGTLTLGSRNVLGTTPPLDESYEQSLNSSLYNSIGRSFFAGYTHSF